jgi:hypothetical protein
VNIRVSVLLLAALPTIAAAQTALPPDIHPVTLSRLPPVTPGDLDAEGQRLLAARQNFTPGPGPTHITVYVSSATWPFFIMSYRVWYAM